MRNANPIGLRVRHIVAVAVIGLFASLVVGGSGASAVTPVTAGCTGTTGDMAALAADVAAVTSGTAEIDLVAGCTYTFDATTPGPLTLAQGIALTIEGNGATITGAASGAIASASSGTSSTLTLDNLRLSGNSGGNGAAIDNSSYGNTLHITNSTFINNTSNGGNGGGAIYTNGGTTTIENSTFTTNHAATSFSDGGAVFNSGGTVTVTNSTFNSNTANGNGGSGYGNGGAIFNSSGTLNVTNSTFTTNHASSWGGAVQGYGGNQTFRNSTFSANGSGLAGAALYAEYNSMTLSGNIFAANKAGSAVSSCGVFYMAPYNDPLIDQGYNVADDNTCFNGGTGDVTTTAAAIGLGSLGPNGGPTDTMAITSTSTAYHVVAAAKCPATDQRGNTRLAVSTTFCDAGAFEVDTAVTTTPITVTVSGSQTYGDASPALTYTASGGSVAGTLTCTGLNVTGNGITTPTAVSSTLAAATGYTLAVSGCSGLSTDANHTIAYVGGTFDVTQATITVTVSGSQTYGDAPSFSYTASGVGGAAVCTTVNGGTPIAPTLAAGMPYTIDASSCGGLSPTDPTDYTLSITGGTFTVNRAVVVVTVSGSQTYGGAPTFTYPATPGVTGTAACTTVNVGTLISPTLGAGGLYTIDGVNCSGLLADANHMFSYSGGQFTVEAATVTVTVAGSKTYGGPAAFTETNDAPVTVTVDGSSLTCANVTLGEGAISTLGVGTYTIDGATCSGATLSDNTDYTIAYVGLVDGFIVNKTNIVVTVNGSQADGWSPVLSYTASGGTVTGTVTCTGLTASGNPVTSTLAAGTYAFGFTNCAGVTPIDAEDYTVSYAGGSFVVTSNLFESDTSCQDYLAGSGTVITMLKYGVKGGQINNVAPGVFSYYTKFAASGATGGVTITQTVDNGGRLFQTLHSQVMVYDSNCNRVPARQVNVTENNGKIVVAVAGLTSGSQYVVSVKYNANGAVGLPVGQPSPTFTYSFSDDAGGAGSLALKPTF